MLPNEEDKLFFEGINGEGIDKTFHVIGEGYGEARVFEKIHWKKAPLEEAFVVILTGGADIHPVLYKNKVHPTTYPTIKRDIRELRALQSIRQDALKIGICRGGQLLCALNGGELYQDIDNHAGAKHQVHYNHEDGTRRIFLVNSLHHQMMKPIDGPVQVWATAAESTYRDRHERLAIKGANTGPDFEVLYYPLTRSLCFQAHPEYDSGSTSDFFYECFSRAVRQCKRDIIVAKVEEKRAE